MNAQQEPPEYGSADADHRKRLARLLNAREDDDKVTKTLDKITKAGSAELLDYCTGKVVPTTFSEVRLNRINYLIKAKMGLPELEAVAAHLLQVPDATAKRLVYTAGARFAYEWDDVFKEAAKEILSAAYLSNGRWNVTITSPVVRKWMDDQIEAEIESSGKLMASIKDKPDQIGDAYLTNDAYDYLCSLVGLS